MRLVRLEAKGFKSFGDKIILHMDRGVTGIVGPNGCGKSNVVDAVRWVLGEQRARYLRSDRMESVIFNGTAKRKSASLAEVTLTFDNDRGILPAAYTQVSVTRRYYRGGESEYLLNGVTCRLRDIESLFMDTGIGPDSYAIIELRMVDDLLQDREGSRRGLFEEAAGVSKYKQRRRETQRRLDETARDLERVEDLLHELTRNLKQLERQARQAEKYLEARSRARHMGLAQGWAEYARRQEQSNKLQAEALELTREADQIIEQIEQQEQTVDELRRLVTDSTQLAESRQRTLAVLQEQIRQIEARRALADSQRRQWLERLTQATDTRAREQSLAGQHEERLRALAAEQEHLESTLAVSQQMAGQQRTGLAALEAEARQAADERARLASSLQARQQQVQALASQAERFRAEQAALTRSRADLHTRLTTAGQALAEGQMALASLDPRLDELTQTVDQTRARQQEREQTLAALTSNLEQAQGTLAQETRRLDALSNEYALTKSLQDNLEGYPEAIRYLRKNHPWGIGGVPPLVSEVLACPEAYRIALERFLEPVLNHYIVASAEEAVAAIGRLREQAKGQASFVLLDHLPARPEDVAEADSPEALPTGATPVLEVVTADASYRPLLAWLLEGCYFLDAPERHLSSAHGEPQLGRTLKGGGINLLARQGGGHWQPPVLSGGSVGLYEGKRVGRVKHLEQLAGQITTLKRTVDKTTQDVATLRGQIDSLRRQDERTTLDKLVREQTQLAQQRTTWQVRQESQERIIQEAEQRIATLDQELAQREARTAYLTPQLAALEQDLSRDRALSETLTAQGRVLEGQLSQARAQATAAETEAIRQEGRLAQIQHEQTLTRQSLTQAQERIDRAQQEAQTIEAQLASLEPEAGQGGAQDEELAQRRQELESVRQGQREAYQALEAARGRLDLAERQGRELARRKDQNQALAMQAQTQAASQGARLEALLERLAQEFDTHLTAEGDIPALDLPEEILGLDEETLQARISEARATLERIGPVNPVAVEQYQELSNRTGEINRQKEDLLAARATLEETISQVEQEARRAFMVTFAAIEENFGRVFRSLFSDEDTCSLKLVDTERPLESPIEITARPKGKRPLSINQLSGGEKTLTAIALLFAIYLIKPAPFCIFDEVDAPLDDANIDKFNRIIRDFSGQSQFIIVTHNKRTMTHANVLYGITMVEQGVSRAIPVDLRQLSLA